MSDVYIVLYSYAHEGDDVIGVFAYIEDADEFRKRYPLASSLDAVYVQRWKVTGSEHED